MFEADSSLTRAMFVTLLGRLEGISSDSNEEQFNDVKTGMWYTPFINWASNNQIVSGYGDDSFGPNDVITREQLCAIMIRYLKYKDINTENGDELNEQAFSDESDISQWAVGYIKSCYRNKLISGKNGNILEPQANASRAEACTVLYRLIKIVLEKSN